jgi:hypothetical protein
MTNKTELKIKEITIKLCEQLSKQNDIVFQKENLDGLFATYATLRDNLRTKMKTETPLDRHKLAALIAFSIVAHNPMLASGDKPSYLARNANYLTALKVGTAILASFKDKNDFKVSQLYTQEFIKLLHLNKNTIKQICETNGLKQVEILFFLSHIYFFIDECEEKLFNTPSADPA